MSSIWSRSSETREKAGDERLVEAMESDLGTRLEWIAIDHNNTENPHAHLLRARGEKIDKERWTETDRALQRRLNAERVADYSALVPYNDAARVRADHEMQRLNFLESIGLARKVGSLAWELLPPPQARVAHPPRAMDVIKRQAAANRVRSLNELADERDAVMTNSVRTRPARKYHCSRTWFASSSVINSRDGNGEIAPPDLEHT